MLIRTIMVHKIRADTAIHFRKAQVTVLNRRLTVSVLGLFHHTLFLVSERARATLLLSRKTAASIRFSHRQG